MSVVLQVSDTHFGTGQPIAMEVLLRLVHAQRFTLVDQTTMGLTKCGDR